MSERQEAYFLYETQCLHYLEWQYQFRRHKIRRAHGLPWPTKQGPPPKHNPPSQHIPHWLSEARTRRHVELALEWEYAAGLRQRPPKRPKEPSLSSRQRRDAAMKRAPATATKMR